MAEYMTRGTIEAAGYVPGWHGEPATVGDRAVAWGTGRWREGVVVKVTPTYVFVQYTAPSSGRVWVTKGRRDGRESTDLYVTCPQCKVIKAQGGFGPNHRASMRCESGRRPHCTCAICF